VNLTLGGLTTAAAGAGAIFTAASTVRALSGVAAIFSGFRAEVNDAYFQNLTIQVITDGFESKRRGIYEEIVNKRKTSTSLIDYPVEKAIGDAIVYHQNCSLIAGLEQAALSIQRAENPGMMAMTRTFKQMTTMSAWADVVAGKKEVGEAKLVEAGVNGTLIGDVNALDAFNQAVGMFKALTTVKEKLMNVEVTTGIKGFVKANASAEEQALQDKIVKFEGKKNGEALLKKVAALVNAVSTEGKFNDTEKDVREKWVQEWNDIESKRRTGKTIDFLRVSKIQAQALGLARHYKDLTQGWAPAWEEANTFLAENETLFKMINKLNKEPLDLKKLDPPSDPTKKGEQPAPEKQKKSEVNDSPLPEINAEKAACQLQSEISSQTWFKEMKEKGGFVVLFRHAEDKNVKRTTPVPVGEGDPGDITCNDSSQGRRNLTSPGIKNVEAVGNSLSKSGIKFDRAYTSPRCRTYDTGQYLVNKIGKGLNLGKEEGLQLIAGRTSAQLGEGLAAFLADNKKLPALSSLNNVLLVSHGENIKGYLEKLPGGMPVGTIGNLEAAVLKQNAKDGKVTYQCAARVPHDKWPAGK